jgi:palmitoyltransferase ZDHHC9/14/18
MRSITDSVTPLQEGTPNKGVPVDSQENYKGGGKEGSAPQRSSFRASFLPGSRSTVQTRISAAGREKGSSALSSPRSGPVKEPPETNHKLGRNYQYFPGNTIFCFGGRLQNTRHQPVNIITGLFVFVPGVLFLVYS